MPTRLESLRIKAKLLQKAKKKAGKSIKLKDAYDLLAKVSGYENWRQQKLAIEKTEAFPQPPSGPQLRIWFRDHELALQHVQENGGFIVPFERDFFIGDDHYLESLGLTKSDSDVIKVGNDWSQPKCMESYKRLFRKVRL